MITVKMVGIIIFISQPTTIFVRRQVPHACMFIITIFVRRQVPHACMFIIGNLEDSCVPVKMISLGKTMRVTHKIVFMQDKVRENM